jgi:hypothetical protein
MVAEANVVPSVPLTPQQRLARSRRAIARQLSNGRDTDDAFGSPQQSSRSSSGAWPLVRQAFGAWWANHPAHTAATLAAPMVRSYARSRPLQMLGLAAGAGAVLVLARPWRRSWFGRAVGGVLGSAEISGLLFSLLNNHSKEDPR